MTADAGSPAAEPVSAPAAGALIPVGEADHVLGAEEPELTLVEYGDFGCPFCFAASRPVNSLLERYPTVRLVWRHFPDPDLHPGADLAAELSELAAADGKFWEAHALLLAGRERFSPADLFAVGARLDLDPADVESVLGDRLYCERVRADVAGGRRAGVHGTPTFFSNGELVRGHWRQLAQLVPAALGEDQA
jgi:protein-disulfide isomerase